MLCVLHWLLARFNEQEFCLSPASFDEMIEGDEWIKSMVEGIEREKKKEKNEKATEDIRWTTKQNKRKAVNVETLTGQ